MDLHIKSILGSLAFSYLFYSKSFGLNTMLLSILVLVFLFTCRKQRPVPWGYSLPYLFTAVMVFIDPTDFKICLHFMAFFVLIGKYIAPTSSLYLSWFIGVVNMIVASLVKLNNYINQPKSQKKGLSKRRVDYIKGTMIAFPLLILFALLYQKANPIFESLIQQINLNFISAPWLLFTLLGYILFVHVLNPYYPKELLSLDQQKANELKHPEEPFTIPILEKLKSEQTLGSIVLSSLNLLLMLFLLTDVIYLLQAGPISNSGYSKSVHEGVYALMFSIVCAIVIILFFFRGHLNFYKGNGRLKKLTYFWIGLNIVLVFFTWYKNFQYIGALGFTYKRIGVFVYLLLTLSGLITAYIKVASVRSYIYLIRTNITIAFGLLLLSASIPWDRAITRYNLKNIQHPDISYLMHLGDTNSEQLYHYIHTPHGETTLHKDTFKEIEKRYAQFLSYQREKTWQEYTMFHIRNPRRK